MVFSLPFVARNAPPGALPSVAGCGASQGPRWTEAGRGLGQQALGLSRLHSHLPRAQGVERGGGCGLRLGPVLRQ